MELKNKIIAGLTGLGIATSVAVVGLDRACYFDAEVLKVSDQKLCFQTKEDYKLYKGAILAKYKPKGTNIFLLIDGERGEFYAILSHESKKLPGGKFTFKNLNKNSDLYEEAIKQIK